MTLVEGSLLTDNDLALCEAHRAEAILLLADRFSSSETDEDLDILFQVWTVKGYTKTVPIYIQVCIISHLITI